MGNCYNLISKYLPLLYVFLSGIGFSIQTLIIKILAENGFHGSFQCVFSRGWIQLIIASFFIYFDKDRIRNNGPKIFGDTNFVKLMMLLRSIIGYGGIAFSFMSVELIPLGDSTVLIMLSPMIASIAGYFILGEPWRLPEFFATLISLIGIIFVVKPPFIFGYNSSNNQDNSKKFYWGVFIALCGAFSAGFAFIFVRILGTTAKMPWSNVCFAQAWGQIILSIPGLYLTGQHLLPNVSSYQLFMIFLSGFIGAWSQISMTLGMQREKSATATAMRMSDVIFGFIWQMLFTHDAVSLLSVFGAILVSSSIIIIVLFKEKDKETTKESSQEQEESIELARMNFTAEENEKLHSPNSSLSEKRIEPFENYLISFLHKISSSEIIRAGLRSTNPMFTSADKSTLTKYSPISQQEDI